MESNPQEAWLVKKVLSMFAALKTNMFKLFVFILFLLGLCAPIPADAQDLSSLVSAVWKIEDDSNYGTAFAISPNLFITNAHNLRDTKHIGQIVLSRDGSSRRLSVSRVLALSLVHDLMLLQTKETVRCYLRFVGPVSREEDGSFLSMGYVKCSLTRIRQIAPIAWRDHFHYALPVHRMSLSGIRGGPTLNPKGEVVAVAGRYGGNMSYGLKAIHAERLLAEKMGVFCPTPA